MTVQFYLRGLDRTATYQHIARYVVIYLRTPFHLFLFLVSCSKCASVAGHFELKEVFDKLIITLCKFTSLLSNHEVCV